MLTASGRGIQKVFTQNLTTATTDFFCDGNDAVEENDQSGSLLAQYARTSNVNEPVARLILWYVLLETRCEGVGVRTTRQMIAFPPSGFLTSLHCPIAISFVRAYYARSRCESEGIIH